MWRNVVLFLSYCIISFVTFCFYRYILLMFLFVPELLITGDHFESYVIWCLLSRNAKGQRDNLAIAVGSWASKMKSYPQVLHPRGGCYQAAVRALKHLRWKNWCGRSRKLLTAQTLFRPEPQLCGPGYCHRQPRRLLHWANHFKEKREIIPPTPKGIS